MEFKETIWGIILLGAIGSLLATLAQRILARVAQDGFLDLASKVLRGFIIGAALLAGFSIAFVVARSFNLGALSSLANSLLPASQVVLKPQPEAPPQPSPGAPPAQQPAPAQPTGEQPAPLPSGNNRTQRSAPRTPEVVIITAEKDGSAGLVGSGVVVSWSPLEVLTASDLVSGTSALNVSFPFDHTSGKSYPARPSAGLNEVFGITALDVDATVSGNTDNVPRYGLQVQENQHIWRAAPGGVSEGAILRLSHDGDTSKFEYKDIAFTHPGSASLSGAALLDDDGNLIGVQSRGAGVDPPYGTRLSAFLEFLKTLSDAQRAALPWFQLTPQSGGELAVPIPLSHHYAGCVARGILTFVAARRAISWHQIDLAERHDDFSIDCALIHESLLDELHLRFALKITGKKKYTFSADSQTSFERLMGAYKATCGTTAF